MSSAENLSELWQAIPRSNLLRTAYRRSLPEAGAHWLMERAAMSRHKKDEGGGWEREGDAEIASVFQLAVISWQTRPGA